jgi:hypothetical protein
MSDRHEPGTLIGIVRNPHLKVIRKNLSMMHSAKR